MGRKAIELELLLISDRDSQTIAFFLEDFDIFLPTTSQAHSAYCILALSWPFSLLVAPKIILQEAQVASRDGNSPTCQALVSVLVPSRRIR